MNLNILRNSMFFYEMEDEWILKALGCLDAFERSYAKGSLLLDNEEIIKEIGILVSGSANIIVETFDGNRSITEKLMPSDVYGESIICSGIQKSSSRIVALENCKVVKIHMENIIHKNLTTCSFRSMIVENLLRLSANRCITLNKKMDILSHKGVRERVLLYLADEMDRCKNCEFSIHFSRNELAEYLRLDRSALSRELSRIKDDGIIDYERSYFHILMPDKLNQLR